MAGKGKQKIEMKLIESMEARTVSFSKRKKSLFKKAEKYATRTGADVGVMLISPSGKPFSYGSTSIETITDKFLEMKLKDRQHNRVDLDKSNVLETFNDLIKEVQDLEEKEKDRILLDKVLHRGSEIPPDKHMVERLVAIMQQLEEVRKVGISCKKAELLKIDLNVAPEPEEESS